MKKQMATLLLAALTMTMAVGCGNDEKKVEGTVAIKVNGDVITQEEIDRNYDSLSAYYNLAGQLDERGALQLKRNVAASLIENELILQEATRRGLKADTEQVASLRAEYQDRYYGSAEALKTALEEQNVTEAEFDEMLEEQVLYNALEDELKKDVTVDAKAYYDANPDEFTVGERVKASHILLETEEEAKDVIAKLDNGADFAELAKEKSIEPAAQSTGGDLGYFTRERMVAEFSDAAFAQEVGTYSRTPVQSEFGYHVIYVEDKKPAGIADFAEVEQSITTRLINQEVYQIFSELLAQLSDSAEIEYINADMDPDAPLPEPTASDDASQGESNDSENTPVDEGENTPAQ